MAFREERLTATAGPDGRVELRLAPGTWFLAASSPDGELVGWHGANPLQVRAGERVEVAIPALRRPPAPEVLAVAAGEEAVEGTVAREDGPVAGASVVFYLDASALFRGPGYLELRTDASGRFETRLSPGRYWIFARRRAAAGAFGPLEAGDDFGFHAGNPLMVREGERVRLRIGAVPVLKKSGWSGPSALRTLVSGTIRDAAGRPLAGYRAFLHAKPSLLGKPDYVSDPSGPDGAYRIWVDREGLWYLGARAEIGRSRAEGEPLALHGGRPDHAVRIRLGSGALGPLDLVVPGAAAP